MHGFEKKKKKCHAFEGVNADPSVILQIFQSLDATVPIYWRFQSAQHVSGDNFAHPQDH
jgi:hypothetical protein